MSVDILRPNGTVSNSGSVVGAASAHAACSDDSDSSYVELDAAPGEAVRFDFDALTLPAGAIIKAIEVRSRTRVVSASSNLLSAISYLIDPAPEGFAIVNWTSPTTVGMINVNKQSSDWTDAEVDAMEVFFGTWIGSSGSVRLYEAYIDCTYVDQPVSSADAPTGIVTTTSRPTVQWTRTLDTDGGVQALWEVKVFDDATYLGGGFDPDTSTPDSQSGIQGDTNSSWQVEDSLINDTYRAYVRVAQNVNGVLHWSDWDFTQWTQLVNVPNDPDIVITEESTDGRVKIELTDNGGAATTDLYQVQRGVDGGDHTNYVTNPSFETTSLLWGIISGGEVLTRTTDESYIGDASLSVTTAASATQGVNSNPSLNVTASRPYTASVYVKAPAGAPLNLRLQERTAADATVGNTDQAFIGTGEWQRVTVTRTFGGTGVKARIMVFQTDSTARTFYMDGALLNAGSAPSAYFDGNGYIDKKGTWRDVDYDGDVTVDWTGVANLSTSTRVTTWADIRTVEGGGLITADGSDDATLYDWEMPEGVVSFYRARALHDYTGVYGESGWVQEGDTFASTSWWFKHPSDFTLNTAVDRLLVSSSPGYTRPAAQSEFKVLGNGNPINVFDSREAGRGDLAVMLEDDDARADLDELLNSGQAVLVQSPASDNWPDRWVVFGEQSRAWAVDKITVADAQDGLPWTEVDRPLDNVNAWPT